MTKPTESNSEDAVREGLLEYLDIFLHPNPEVNLGGMVCQHGLAIEACPARECNNPLAYDTAIKRARDYIAALVPRAEVQALRDRVAELEARINTPETGDFLKGVCLEAAHQRERWGAQHDAGKSAFDWFWLIGYLAQKAASAEVAGDIEKARHHTISTAAALSNWHLRLSGGDGSMRPGFDPSHFGDGPQQ